MAGLIVIRNTDMPAVLVEMDFIDNDDGADLLIAQQDDFARAIARGITDYFQ
jgi:N-acetylmuramoyl-L-alanine amidase